MAKAIKTTFGCDAVCPNEVSVTSSEPVTAGNYLQFKELSGWYCDFSTDFYLCPSCEVVPHVE